MKKKVGFVLNQESTSSHFTNIEYENLKNRITNFVPSGFIIIRFELPFQLPIEEVGGIYSKKYRKGIKVKHKKIYKGYSEVESIVSEVDIISPILKRITVSNKELLINISFEESLEFLNNVIKVLITTFRYSKFTTINRYNLPEALPVWICNKTKFEDQNLEKILFMNFHFANIQREQVILKPEERQELISRVELLTENPYFESTVLFSEASNLYRVGSFHSGFVKMHASVELMMYAIVKEIFIKKKKKIDNLPQIAYKNLLTQHLGPYLTENNLLFDISDNKSIAYEYWNEVYLIRNNIVHAGYRITEFEARRAHEIIWKLVKSIIIKMKNLGYKNIIKYTTDSEESLKKGYFSPF